MVKKINISSINRKTLREALPHGAQPAIRRRLAKKGVAVSLSTVTKAFAPDYPLTRKRLAVIREAVAYLEESKTVAVTPQTESLLTNNRLNGVNHD